MKNFKVIDFEFAYKDNKYDLKFKQDGAWSRIYEYEYVLDHIRINKNDNCKIHNTSWGFEGIHVDFRDSLDELGDCVHSDIVSSKYRDTYHYDITTEHKEFEEKFDFVLNVSTIEHLKTSENRIKSIENLFKQVKKGGYLILTFDYPRVNLKEIENLVGEECINSNGILLNGSNSINPNLKYKDLNIVYLILEKENNLLEFEKK